MIILGLKCFVYASSQPGDKACISIYLRSPVSKKVILSSLYCTTNLVHKFSNFLVQNRGKYIRSMYIIWRNISRSGE